MLDERDEVEMGIKGISREKNFPLTILLYAMIKPYVFYDILKLLIKEIPKPIGVSIDITNRCNLKCKHYYFWRQNYKTELDDNNWLNKLFKRS